MKRNGTVVFAPREGMGAGKGDFPRNLSEQFRQNHDRIDWTRTCEQGCQCVLCK